MIRPNNFLFLGWLLWLILAIASVWRPPMTLFWEITGLILLLLSCIEAWQVYHLPSPIFERQLLKSLPLGVWTEVNLKFHNASSHSLTLDIFDDYPIHSQLLGLPQKLTLPPHSQLTTAYKLCPQRRGLMAFKGIYLLIYSPWHFWKQARYLPLAAPVRVYPNFAATTKYALLATENRLGQLGIHKLPRRGEGLDFHQLREYRSGDALRQIDWNTTSRYRKLISKEYQDERDQTLIFLLDCGRRMTAQDGTFSHFDDTLNAVLLLSYVALRQGDALGLMTLSGETRWLAPRKGKNTLNLILNTVYDLQPSAHTSDYLAAAQQLMEKHRKRALVVLITNLRDEDTEELLPALQLLRRKHLILLASLQEKIITEVLEHPVHNFEEALRQAATYEYLQHRQHLYETLTHQGVLCVDTEPELLPIKIVNAYLEIKARNAL